MFKTIERYFTEMFYCFVEIIFSLFVTYRTQSFDVKC